MGKDQMSLFGVEGFIPSSEEDWHLLEATAKQIFRPTAPIDEARLFAGRLFSAGDVREPYSKIRGKPVDIPYYAAHLKAFCDKNRGPTLIKAGKPKGYKYHFANPLLEPLVIMIGMSEGLIDRV